jgi:hypothetical protein
METLICSTLLASAAIFVIAADLLDTTSTLVLLTPWESRRQGRSRQCAEKADPGVDLEWMRIRYETDLNKR